MKSYNMDSPITFYRNHLAQIFPSDRSPTIQLLTTNLLRELAPPFKLNSAAVTCWTKYYPCVGSP